MVFELLWGGGNVAKQPKTHLALQLPMSHQLIVCFGGLPRPRGRCEGLRPLTAREQHWGHQYLGGHLPMKARSHSPVPHDECLWTFLFPFLRWEN